jgi:multimeric flavodoxin WrbA
MIKNRKFFMCFSINTTHSGRETSNFACDKYLTIFAMEKEKRNYREPDG